MGYREVVLLSIASPSGPPRPPESCTKMPTFEAVPSGISGTRQMQLPRVAAT